MSFSSRSGHNQFASAFVRSRGQSLLRGPTRVRSDISSARLGRARSRSRSRPHKSPLRLRHWPKPARDRATSRPSASPTSARRRSYGIATPASPSTTRSSGKIAAPPISASASVAKATVLSSSSAPDLLDRFLFFRHQNFLDSRKRLRRARPCRSRQARVRHRRYLAALETHRRTRSRHRSQQRLAHHALQYSYWRMGSTNSSTCFKFPISMMPDGAFLQRDLW